MVSSYCEDSKAYMRRRVEKRDWFEIKQRVEARIGKIAVCFFNIIMDGVLRRQE